MSLQHRNRLDIRRNELEFNELLLSVQQSNNNLIDRVTELEKQNNKKWYDWILNYWNNLDKEIRCRNENS